MEHREILLRSVMFYEPWKTMDLGEKKNPAKCVKLCCDMSRLSPIIDPASCEILGKPPRPFNGTVCPYLLLVTKQVRHKANIQKHEHKLSTRSINSIEDL
jgi:hypothetical protein